MTKRKPVLVLFIIAALLLIAGAVLFLVPTMFDPVTGFEATFIDLNRGIINVFSGTNMVRNIISVSVTAVLFIIIPLIVHIKRKQTSVTITLLLGALVIFYVDLLLLSYSEIKIDLIKEIIANKVNVPYILIVSLGLIGVADVLELVIFIVDMAIRVNNEEPTVATAQAVREEEKVDEEPEPQPVEEPAAVVEEEPAQVVAAPVEENKQEEVEEEVEPQPVEEEPKEEKKPAKKASSTKKPAKKATKKAEAKKAEPKKAEKKPSETQTIKKAEILTNEEGKQFVKAYHISQRKELNKWQVKGAGSEKALKLFDTQKEAIEYANELSAKNGAAVRVHSRAGKMRKA